LSWPWRLTRNLSNPLVYGHRADNQNADEQVGPLRVGDDQAQAERKDANNESAEDHPENRPAATEQRDAANHHCGDRFDVGEFTRRRRDRTDAAYKHPTRQTADQTRYCIYSNKHARHRDTGKSSGLGIVTYRIDPAAPCRIVENVPEEADQQHHEDNTQGENGAANPDLRAK